MPLTGVNTLWYNLRRTDKMGLSEKRKRYKVMSNQPNVNNRLKGLRIPIEVCVKFERLAGVKAKQEPTPQQRLAISKMMVSALVLSTQNVQLNAEDYEQIAEEVKRNEQR